MKKARREKVDGGRKFHKNDKRKKKLKKIKKVEKPHAKQLDLNFFS
jgi:hypothetical protein